MSGGRTVVLAAAGSPYGEVIAGRLSAGGWRVAAAASAGEASALVFAPALPEPATIGELDVDAFLAAVDGALVEAGERARSLAAGNAASRRIVFLGSTAAAGGEGGSAAAAVSGGLLGLGRSLAIELDGVGITVNAVLAPVPPPAGSEAAIADGVAEAVAFLLAPGAAAVSGQVIAVCGAGAAGTMPP